MIVAGPVMGLIGGGAVNLLNVGNMVRSVRPMARVTLKGKQFNLNRDALARVQLRPYELFGYEMEMPYMVPWNTKINIFAAGGPHALRASQPSVTLRGEDTLQAARIILPRINASGGSAAVVRDAVDILETTPQAHDVFVQAAETPHAGGRLWWAQGAFRMRSRDGGDTISALPPANRLALEMILHETDERRALEGELAALEERWKDAEEIAAISDDMFLPSGIVDRLHKFREG